MSQCKRIVLEVRGEDEVYGPDDWFIGSLQHGNAHFGEPVESKEKGIEDNVKYLIKLKDAGFSGEEILEMKKNGLL